MSDFTEYRLSWQSINHMQAAMLEDTHGKDIWRRLSESEWDSLDWKEPTVVVFIGDERRGQHATLTQRLAPAPDEGWEPA